MTKGFCRFDAAILCLLKANFLKIGPSPQFYHIEPLGSGIIVCTMQISNPRFCSKRREWCDHRSPTWLPWYEVRKIPKLLNNHGRIKYRQKVTYSDDENFCKNNKNSTKTKRFWIISLAWASVFEGCFYLEINSLTILLQFLIPKINN